MTSEPQETLLVSGPDRPQTAGPVPLEQIHRLLFKIRLGIVVSVVVTIVIALVADTLLSFWPASARERWGARSPS